MAKKKIKKRRYRVGDLVRIELKGGRITSDCDVYMLARVSTTEVAAINLLTGNRWANAVPYEPREQGELLVKEVRSIVDYDTIELVRAREDRKCPSTW
jgi:hypothetical protein